MRGKRSKQYRKLMHQYGLIFGFREPYQVLVDVQILQDAARFNMDLVGGLARTLHGEVKPMITQCSMRHLYNADPKSESLILQAKDYERRRCDHHLLEEPLSTLECLKSVVDSKGHGTNKHRYVIASQDTALRSAMRKIPGVPLIYINRSVMIMEPMASATEQVKEKEEREKFRNGLKTRPNANTRKRAWEDDEEQDATSGAQEMPAVKNGISTREGAPAKKKKKGPKGPNPLSVKKAKPRQEPTPTSATPMKKPAAGIVEPPAEPSANREAPAKSDGTAKGKRKRKPKPKVESAGAASDDD